MSAPLENDGLHLDNAAAAAVSPSALKVFCEAATAFFANQEGAGLSSSRSAEAVAEASASFAEALLKGENAKVVWTNSGTEALCAAVEAAVLARKGSLVRSDVEHPALARAIDRAAASKGLEVRRAKIGSYGQLDLEQLESLLDEKTSLVALHHVHAETGALQNLAAVRSLIDKKAPKALFLADAVQSAFKLPLPWDEAKLDVAAVSGAKIGAPCGAALLVREDPKNGLGKALRALRSEEHSIGRCPPAACIAMAALAQELSASLTTRLDETSRLKKAFEKEIEAAIGKRVRFTVPEKLSSPYILHMLIREVQGATIVRMLSEKGFSVSAGSACDAEAKSPSRAMLAMGVPRAEAYSALRLSFWSNVKPEDAKPFAEALAACVASY